MINHRLLFLFQWKYMRENLFLCRVYICNKMVEVESVLHLLFYIWNLCLFIDSKSRKFS